MLQGSYSYPLVFASLFIATIASYTTLDLVGRISALGKSAYRVYWLIGGAIAMGLGIWSMHFVGMLSFSLPIPLGYDPTITFYSLLIACGVSYFALDLVTRGQLSFARMTVSGVLMGLGIASMHYTGMAALRMQPEIDYTVTILIASVLIAIVASIAALWLANALRTTQPGLLWLHRLGAALLMGLAITGMHYTGMAAAKFPTDSICRAANGISTNWLALSVGGTTLSILAITMVLSVLDARLQLRTNVFVKRLQHQATHDGLTGLPNRVLLAERIDSAIARHNSQSGTPFAVFFIDLDGFKTINDSFGHNIGDAVLKDLAQRLQAVMRKDDMLARFGGDEFIVLAEGVTDDTAAVRIAEKLLSSFKTGFKLPGIEMGLSPSIGIAIFPRDGDNIDTLLSHADAAMYQVKTSGRNNYRFFEVEMNVATLRLVTIQQGLQAAVRENQLFLHYQPKFNCIDNSIQGAEALLRWQHPELGLISPAEFIPIAEKSGQIISVGQWVIEQVCRELSEWRAAGHAMIRIAINLSLVQLRSPSLVQDILTITGRYGVPPEMLMLEITESAAMENAEETRSTVDKLKSVGFMLAIDDFGTGYSSLSHLQDFGVHQMKVDRAFIKTLTREEGRSRSIVSAIIGLAHALEMEVVAEGVETRAQLDVLQELRCDQTQGFLLARPMPKEEFLQLLEAARHASAQPEQV
ncbi:EAL domain-containing protein [Noviherbaspirillum sp. CPCC 100848]|uniref:EAL domain-containing protein n=1 Tax=Noviherbaspirillum album TaxID=3080276 RepID=A0ABU6J8W1_9BURK|nr:EAL domain-containing protein [Noviherbaspirillum sp. CPCC 100848]MEC4719871.1 EAL domain-containing protein [Noviherbaspirillum sp. CPCC 100848]